MSEILKLHIDDRGVATIALNRPEIHNAFNAGLVAALSRAFDKVESDNARVVVLTGEGHSFSAGADLNWMRSMADGSEDENRADARQLAAMLRKLNNLPCPTIARVNGHAFGGGVGLIACCDMSVALESALFGLTEVRLGLAPATISPFVVARIGVGHARHYMLTGQRINAEKAVEIGLVNHTVPAGQLDSHVEELVSHFLAGGPQAQAATKALIHQLVEGRLNARQTDTQTSDVIAALRVSPEGQEGLGAFLEKRRPAWVPTDPEE